MSKYLSFKRSSEKFRSPFSLEEEVYLYLDCMHGGRQLWARSSQLHVLHIATVAISAAALLKLHAEKSASILTTSEGRSGVMHVNKAQHKTKRKTRDFI